MPAKLKELHKDGYRVIFFSNQGGIEKKKAKISDLQTKVNAIVKELGIPVYVISDYFFLQVYQHTVRIRVSLFQAFMATGENHYRKPSSEMWDHFVENCNKGVKVSGGLLFCSIDVHCF